MQDIEKKTPIKRTPHTIVTDTIMVKIITNSRLFFSSQLVKNELLSQITLNS